MTRETKIIVLLVISALISLLIWRHIFLTKKKSWSMVAYLVLSAIPVFGPIFYIMIDSPEILPLDQQQKRMPKGTEVYPSFEPLTKSVMNIFRRRKNPKK